MGKVHKMESEVEPQYQSQRNMTIVPDNTGTKLIAFYHERGESRVEQYPVLAWKISNGQPTPITVETIDAPVYCLKLSTGLWTFPSDTSFTDEEKAQEYGKSRAKLWRESNA